ncbi:RidA family protein [Allostreptomyces psammosilenae]|uniref:Reactive intermediate/imine deaminase n=1 Tax=Allostreptomyces psammosilenae TaxID=1892865 RepID=A0A853A5Y8_9ACTN|nr:Rid family detoxifying hydrolase [Allostreptomyces psammosilenae]NYI06101.1 reactive intermediate/imine deaminase [Allostreptomyces psammosilenae]
MSDSTKYPVRTDRAPVPVARFSQAVAKGGLLAVAGQMGFDPETGAPVGPGLAEQVHQSMRNLQTVLAEGGATFDDVIMVRVYLTDTDHFAEFNRLYDSWFENTPGGAYPARTTVYVGLPAGLLVEIDALAVIG